MTRALRVLGAALMLAALFVLPDGNRHSAAAGTLAGPKSYYLALGDDMAFGYQPNGDYLHGYADGFFAYLQPRGTSALINMGCPGEKTTTMIAGGCPGAALVKYPYAPYPNQLAAAVGFIKAHAGQVSPVTLDIGVNDIYPDISMTTCTTSPAFPTDTQNVINNVPNILNQLQAALGGSGDLILMLNYDPFQNICPALTPVIEYFNQGLEQAAYNAGALVADTFASFGGPTTPNPNICTYTWMCSSTYPPGAAIYPTTPGYAVIAQTFESAVNYPAPSIGLNRTSGAVGQSIAITGSTFGAHEAVDVYLDSPNTVLTATTSNAAGAFATRFKLPAASYGRHTVIAVGQTSNKSAGAAFWVQPHLSLTPDVGRAGTAVAAGADGFDAGETVTLYWKSPSGRVLGTTITDSQGSATIDFKVPPSPPGRYSVYAVGGASNANAQATFAVR